MEIKDLVKKYWQEAVGAERKLKAPAIYLLAHAIVETDGGIHKAENLAHGFEVIIPVKINKFKQFWIDVLVKIKSWFKKEEQIVVKEVVSTEEHVDDYIIHFFNNVSYHAKFEYLQSIDRFADFVWRGKQYEYIYMKKFKDTVNEIKETMSNNAHL